MGTQALSTVVYTATGDKLPVRVEYGNGGKVHYDRDAFKRVTAVRYDAETQPRYEYAFDASGNTARVKDNHLGRDVTEAYDFGNRPMRTTAYEGTTRLYAAEAAYDACNRYPW